MITKEIIKSEYELAIKEAAAMYPLEKWVVQPTFLSFMKRKRATGLATSLGEIKINIIFIGTESINYLRNTIRHEITHLIVGLNHSHNKVFKRVLEILTRNITVLEGEKKAILGEIVYKYTLFAHMEDGSIELMGQTHKRTKKYLNATSGTIDGAKGRFTHFEYKLN